MQRRVVFEISIHAPREGGDKPLFPLAVHSGYFNPRPPRGGRHCRPWGRISLDPISIHAPREGGDSIGPSRRSTTLSFQSTPPARGATLLVY